MRLLAWRLASSSNASGMSTSGDSSQSRRQKMSEALNREVVKQRLLDFPRDNYFYIGNIVRGVALYWGSVVLLEILGRFDEEWPGWFLGSPHLWRCFLRIQLGVGESFLQTQEPIFGIRRSLSS